MKSTKQLIFILLINLLIINHIESNKIKTNSELKKSQIESQMKITTKYCGPLCRECSENDQNFCTLCRQGSVFYKYNCYIKCPDGTYKDEFTGECLTCNGDCPICWGSEPDMCGNNPGVKSSVVNLEREVIDFFNSYTFTHREVDDWIKSLKIILDKESEEKMYDDPNIDKFSQNEIYSSESKEIDLPFGSFSKLDGVFIPVPSYVNMNKELVNSHWVFKKGQWDGRRWTNQHFPRLPKIITLKGEKNKIYLENGGFWVWDSMRDWFWIKSMNVENIQLSTVHDTIALLNHVRVDLGDYNMRRFKESQELKKLNLQNNIKTFFDNFLNTDKIIFSEMKQTFNDEQNNFIQNLEDLKNQASHYFGENHEDKNVILNKTDLQSALRLRNPDHTEKERQFNNMFNKEKKDIMNNLMNTINRNYK